MWVGGWVDGWMRGMGGYVGRERSKTKGFIKTRAELYKAFGFSL